MPVWLRTAGRWLGIVSRSIAVAGALAAIVAASFLAVVAWQALRELPEPRDLHTEALAADTIITDRFGNRLAALRGNGEHREIVARDAISPYLRDAVVASEDARFWEHRGVDATGIARAAWANVIRGRKAQGGSTITQQLLKLTLLGDRPALLRKFEEVFLAHAFEQTLTKEELLAFYLNAVYFGGGSAGVEAAARERFGHGASAVSLAEAALLIGAIPAPAKLTPFCVEPGTVVRPHHGTTRVLPARARQLRVLRRMYDLGMISAAESAYAEAAPVHFRLADDAPPPWVVAPLLDTVDARAAHASRRWTSSAHLALQASASAALREYLERYAQRRGEHGGPRTVLEEAMRGAYMSRLRALRAVLGDWGTGAATPLVYDFRSLGRDGWHGDPCRYGATIFRVARARGYATGIVTELHAAEAVMDLGDFRGRLSRRSIAWTRRALAAVAPVGAVLDVRLPNRLPRERGTIVDIELVPRPVVEGAVVALDPRTREVLALVGGYEPQRGMLNRALSARRPIGSTAKPFVLAAALAAKTVEAGSVIVDAPMRYVDPWTKAEWTPQNWYAGNLGPMLLTDAMARSVNAAAVEVGFLTGVRRTAMFLEAAGFPRAIEPRPSMLLGAIEATPLELANLMAVFASGGRVAPSVFIAREHDAPPAGTVIFDPALVAAVDGLLRQPIAHPSGTARRLHDLGLGIRGKTGTTNDARDAWFVGYTSDILVAVWVGYDQPHPLRTGTDEESGGSLAVPVAEAIFRTVRAITPTTPPHEGGEMPTIAHAFTAAAPFAVREAFAGEEREP